MYPHQIRLGEPWERLGGEPPRFRRRFGRPSQLDEWERVWLIAVDSPAGEWQLNGIALEWNSRGDGLRRANVTGMLRERNEIIAESMEGKFGGGVLEIGCRAFIQNVIVGSERVAIEVSSDSGDDPLELYVLINGETFGYFGPFSTNGMLTHEFRLDEVEWKAGAQVRVDLICRSTIWDTVQRKT